MNYDRKLKIEYNLTSTHNKIDNKLPRAQETEQSQNEYFQEVRLFT